MLRVGTSGWSYDDWIGKVYPPSLPAAEWLHFVAERFPTVEVNSTFYHTPAPGIVAGWLAKVRDRPGFEFSLKAPQALTQEALASGSPDDAGDLARAWRRAVAEPLHDAGRVGAVLLQLAPAVRWSVETRHRLEAVFDALAGLPLALEPRHGSWLAGGALAREALALLDARDVALVALDGPSFPALVAGDASHAYVRFHGRNADVWFAGRKVEEDPDDPRLNRYDYAYEDDELAPWAERLAALARRREVVRIYFNNHPEGHAFRDAERFERALAEAGAAPERAARGPQRTLDGF